MKMLDNESTSVLDRVSILNSIEMSVLTLAFNSSRVSAWYLVRNPVRNPVRDSVRDLIWSSVLKKINKESKYENA
jgi:hypothetical protein